jgi:CRISPR-associated protein Csm3
MAIHGYRTKEITGRILVLTGLHIGAGNDAVEIGGMDNPIIKDPATGYPYIPGSSIKGKMRSLMEWYLDKVKGNGGEPCKCGECPVCRVFGCALGREEKGTEKAKKRGPTRLVVRDSFVIDESITTGDAKKKRKTPSELVEDKSENSINRITAIANPRHSERVIPGVSFNFSLVYKLYDMGDGFEEDEKNFNEVVLKGLKLLENDYLGGGGSRGSGKIQFKFLKDETGADIDLGQVEL